MLEENEINGILVAFKRIFAMPISKSTFRQVQNVLTANIEDEQERGSLFQSLLTASFKQGPKEKQKGKLTAALLEEFCIPVRMAKEVEERGELLMFITSDIIRQSAQPILINHARRVDGQEFSFFTDQETTIHLVEHFVKRLLELDRGDKQFKEKYKKGLVSIKTMVDNLT